MATLEPDPVGKFKIGTREIDALSHITSIASVKALVAYHIKFNPDVDPVKLTITTPAGRVFKASELMNATKFVKYQFASIYADESGNERTQAIKAKIDIVVKSAIKHPLNWELVGSAKPADIMKMFQDTAKAMVDKGEISSDDVKLLAYNN